MSKLYFYYGTVCSSKTLNLLAVYKNYEIQGRKAILIKPECDSRTEDIESRAGLNAHPDIILKKSDSILESIKTFLNNEYELKSEKIPEILLKSIDAVIVDECQFLTVSQINELRQLSIGVYIEYSKITKKSSSKINKISISNHNENIPSNTIEYELPVLCYGLRTDCEGNLWDASAVLMAQADELHEVKTVCSFCNKRAVFSAINPEEQSKSTSEGVFKPSWNYFIPVCPEHYFSLKNKETKTCKN